MADIHEEIDVAAPPEQAYEVWRDFDGYTRFVKGVERIDHDGNVLHWKASTGPKTTEWDAKIVADDPGRRLAWVAPDGPIDTDIRFEPLGDGGTRVVFHEHMHDSIPATLAAASGLGGSRARDDLQRFKDLVEGRDPNPLGND